MEPKVTRAGEVAATQGTDLRTDCETANPVYMGLGMAEAPQGTLAVVLVPVSVLAAVVAQVAAHRQPMADPAVVAEPAPTLPQTCFLPPRLLLGMQGPPAPLAPPDVGPPVSFS
jgi:hypothetical protein